MNTEAQDVATFTQGAQGAEKSPEEKTQYQEECADAKRWLKKIKEARKFDEPARKQYALDRRTARGDGFFEVNIPIAGPYIDILVSFLYAKNPDLDVQPSDSTEPPPMGEMLEMAREQVGTDPKTHEMMVEIGQKAELQAAAVQEQSIALAGQEANTAPGAGVKQIVPPAPLPPPGEVGEQAAQAWLDATIKAKVKEIMAPYKKRLNDAKQLGKTIELVVAKLWKQACLKKACEDQTRSALTVGIGWIKATWQERSGADPVVQQENRDVTDALGRLTAAQTELEDGDAPDDDAARADIAQKLAGLEAKVEVVISRGLAIDFVRAEDIQVSTDIRCLRDYLDSPWISHRNFMTKDNAQAQFPDIKDKISKATNYYQAPQVDPKDQRDVGEAAAPNIQAIEADAYRTSADTGDSGEREANVCVWELWNRDNNAILTLIEGVECYARPSFIPTPGTTRFYSFLQLAFIWVDGERHPQSYTQRSQKLLDEESRVFSARAEHRRRTKPKTAFNKGLLDPAQAAALSAGGTQEMIGLDLTDPTQPIANALVPIKYAKMDEALYNDQVIMAKLEVIWGIQEALSSSIQTAKTATEAEIQQTGTNARTSHKRDAQDYMMSDLAQFSAEIALQKLTTEDARQIAGPWAFWPENMTVEDLPLLVEVQIKGGSAGKPDTSAQQQSWATLFPIVKDAIVQIGQLRGSTPADIADGIEELVVETFARTGDRLDASRFIPSAPSNEPGSMPAPMAPPGMAPQGPPGQSPAMPANQPPPNNPSVLPVPHNAHVLAQSNGAHH